jgi:hypothetical protein
LARYRSDLAAYARDNLRIVTKQSMLVPLELNLAQRIVQARLSRQMREQGRVRAILLKARQEGLSTLVAARGYRRVHLYRHQKALVIADLKKRGAELFQIYDTFHRHLPDWIKPRKRYAQKASQLWYDTPDGSGLNSKLSVETAGDVVVGRGSTIHFLHASEFAFWDNADTVFVGLMQAIPDKGSEVIIESTANGVGNLFHQIWESAERGENEFLPIFLPWWIHEEYRLDPSEVSRTEILMTLSRWEREAMEEGVEWEQPSELTGTRLASGAEWNPETGKWRLSLEQIAWRRDTIRNKLQGDERMFRQEYPATAREAFLVSGDGFFDEVVLLQYEERCRPPAQRGRLATVNDGIVVVPDPRGPLRIWKRPQDECEYVIFADTATGKQILEVERTALSEAEAERGGRDFSAAYVLCTVHREYVACLHGRMVPEVFARQLYYLGYLYSGPKSRTTSSRLPAYIAVERNHSSGETVLRMLDDGEGLPSRYPFMHYHQQINRRTNRKTNVLGWQTTEENRQVVLDQFAQAMREGWIDIPDRDLVRECFTFVRGKDGKPQAQEGCHDDRVIAAAGAWQLALIHRPRPDQAWDNQPRVGTSPTGWGDY